MLSKHELLAPSPFLYPLNQLKYLRLFVLCCLANHLRGRKAEADI